MTEKEEKKLRLPADFFSSFTPMPEEYQHHYTILYLKLFPKPLDGIHGLGMVTRSFVAKKDMEDYLDRLVKDGRWDPKDTFLPVTTGTPFFVTQREDFAEEVQNIQTDDDGVRKLAEINDREKQLRQKTRKEIDDKVKELKAEGQHGDNALSRTADRDSLAYYTEQRVKATYLVNLLRNIEEKKKQGSAGIKSALSEMKRLDAIHPTYAKEWEATYREEMTRQGIPADAAMFGPSISFD